MSLIYRVDREGKVKMRGILRAREQQLKTHQPKAERASILSFCKI